MSSPIAFRVGAFVVARSGPVGEGGAAQGQAVDVGVYYQPDPARTAAAMRPSPTFNRILAQLD